MTGTKVLMRLSHHIGTKTGAVYVHHYYHVVNLVGYSDYNLQAALYISLLQLLQSNLFSAEPAATCMTPALT